MFRSVLFALPLVAVGCATPTSGTYAIVYGEAESDCESSDTGASDNESEELDIEVNDDATEVNLGSFEEPCPLEGLTFTCTSSFETDYGDMGAGDAVVTLDTEVTGTWKSSSTIEGTLGFDITCAGADCETLGVESCSTSGPWTGTLQE